MSYDYFYLTNKLTKIEIMSNIIGKIAQIAESEANIFIAHILFLFSYNESSLLSMTIRTKNDRRNVILRIIGIA